MSPTVSVVLCNYNQAEYVTCAIKSVLSQTYNDFELLLIDNGSTDGSQEVIRAYGQDQRVRMFLFPENQAITARLNAAVRESRGEFISLLYADDYYLPRKLELQVKSFRELQLDYGVVYGPGYRLHVASGAQTLDPSFDGSGSVLPGLLRNHQRGFINPISPLIKKICFELYPYDDSQFVQGESINLYFAMKYRFHFDPEPLVVMREHGSNEGKRIGRNMRSFISTLDSLTAHADFPVALARDVRALQARVYRSCAWQGIRVLHDGEFTRRCAREAVKKDLVQLLHPKLIVAYLVTYVPAAAQDIFNRLVNLLRGGAPLPRVESHR